jgi:hypothetical protein
MARAIRRTIFVGLSGQSLRLALCLALCLALGACGTSLSPNQKDGVLPGEASFTQFKDIPVPSGASMNTERSLITGTQDAWIGRLVFTSFSNSTEMFDFYKNNATGFNWEEMASVRSKVSVLTYTRAERVMTVQIQDRWLWGSEVEVTVTPRGTPGGGMSGGGGGLPPIGRAPSVPVQRGP